MNRLKLWLLGGNKWDKEIFEKIENHPIKSARIDIKGTIICDEKEVAKYIKRKNKND